MSTLSAEKGLSANLDLLRAIAVALVLAQHLSKRLYVDQFAWMPTSSWGLFGVLLFFVHTCLVLMYSMERSGLTGGPLVKNFAIRRIFRIYPLSILAVVTALALHLDSDINGIHGLSHGHFPGFTSAASNLLLVQNLTYAKSIVNVLWSLPFELQMYAFLPFLFMWIYRSGIVGKRLTWPLVALWIVSVGPAIGQPHAAALSRLSILLFIPNFLPGVIAYTIPHRPRISSVLWPVFILLLVVGFAARPVLSTGWILCMLLGLMIPHFREIQLPWLRWISNRIATYSYGIYLSHQFSLWIAFGPLAGRSLALRIPVLVVMLISLPVIFYHAIEKPMIKVGVRLAARISNPPASAAGPSVVAAAREEPSPSKLNLGEEVAP
ncbi:MAG: acyltransferase [Terriglobales bacterium]|jgi:peptidoglycan/LPS O-acetylase OafA/YrhL